MAGLVGGRLARAGTGETYPVEEAEQEEEEDCEDCVLPLEEDEEDEDEEDEGPVSSGGQISGSASRMDTSQIRGGKVESQQWITRMSTSTAPAAPVKGKAMARLWERLPCLGVFAVMEMGAEMPGLFEA